MIELEEFVADFATAIQAVDSLKVQARNQRSGIIFQPGIGPHSESETLRLVMTEVATASPDIYGRYSIGVPYPNLARQRCDLCLGAKTPWEWVCEFKLLRLFGDNGKPNDNMLMHILSPYPQHRSALTDCEKLVLSGFEARKAIVIFGYDHHEWPLERTLEAFELLASKRVGVSRAFSINFWASDSPCTPHRKRMRMGAPRIEFWGRDCAQTQVAC